MKRVLVPYNFTEACLNAVQYAFTMYEDDAEFTIVHVADELFSLNDPETYPIYIDSLDAVSDEIIKHVNEMKMKIGSAARYTVDVQIGNVVKTILKVMETEKIDEIVMATRDKYDVFDKLFGTISLGVVKRSSIPVYLIPNNCHFSVFKRIVIGTDYHFESDRLLEFLIKWNTVYKADLHFIHIIDGKTKSNGFTRNIVEEFFEKRNLDYSFSIIQKEQGNIAKEILAYVQEKKADLHINVTDNMTWLDTITSSSISKKLILQAKTPLLFVPSGQTKRAQILFTMATA